MADPAYEKAVKETFETKPLRTVLLIDDEFPTFAELAAGETDGTRTKFKQANRAVGLYLGFRSRNMICDVENSVGELHTERFRKSDLLILDYHLGPGESDTDRSIKLLRELASTRHFNTVVVYTAEEDLAQVWLDIISGISGGWTQFEEALAGEARNKLDTLSDQDRLPVVSREAVMQYARRRMIRELDPGVSTTAREELAALDVAKDTASDVLTAMFHRELGGRARPYANVARREAVGGFEDGVYWIQTENSFVCVLKKFDGMGEGNESDRLMSYLSRALCAWHPNLVHILTSEIQNILESEALASADGLLRDPITHTALWYYLLTGIGCIDPQEKPDIRPSLVELVNKVVDGVRQRLSTDEELLALVSDAVFGELIEMDWTSDTWPKRGDNGMFEGAREIARTAGLANKADVFFRLNSFWSTEPFRNENPTTGTVCWDRNGDEYFVVASPACDLVARQPNSSQRWSHSIHPLTPMLGIWLRRASVDGTLVKAERGHHIFLELEAGKLVFNVLNDAGQPSFEFLFAVDQGRVREIKGRIVFDVARVVGGCGNDDGGGGGPDTGEGDLNLQRGEFEVIGQLRDMNATRIMHLAGQHLSRIGLDFLNMPS